MKPVIYFIDKEGNLVLPTKEKTIDFVKTIKKQIKKDLLSTKKYSR